MKRLTFTLALMSWASLAHAAPDAEAWDFWADHDPDSAEVLSHAAWQEILQAFVTESADGVNRVDYTALAAPRNRAQLNDYLSSLTAVDPRSLNRAEQFAYWVNFYNAMTLEVVLRYPRKKSILRMGEKLLAVGPWDDVVATIAGQPVTLNDVEHRILRPIWQDHRIHFAVNCASIGCPNLNKIAYTSANTETLLAASEVDYLSHPRGVAREGNTLTLSNIFKWYRADFADSERVLVDDYIATHRADAAAAPEKGRLKIKYSYDWSLNRLSE